MKYFFTISLLLLLLSCKTETETTTNLTSKLLPNNKLIEVVKIEKIATRKGYFTGSDYGSTHSFEYEFTINSNEVIWKDKGSAVPKKILFCNDTTYIKYMQKKSIPYQEIRNDTIKITKYRDSIIEKYDVFIDNRYFFKLFGDVSWVTIPENKYHTKKENCNEYNIPNDGDFKNIENTKVSYTNYEVLKDSVVYHYVYRSGVNWYRGEAASFTVKKADPKTFVELTKKYAKDSLNIYHKGHKIRHRDVNTFRVIKKLVAADKYGVYIDNKIIKGSHGPSFKFLSKDNYGIDNNQMYYLGRNFYRVLKGIDKKNAEILDCDTCMNRYVTDKKQVYHEGKLIKAAHVDTFKVIYFDYSKDDEHIFHENQIIKEADYNSFHILKEPKHKGKVTFHAADKNNNYGSDHYNQLIIHKK